MKALCFGSVNIDYVYAVDHLALPGETISSDSVKRNLGGKGANQAIAMAKTGMEIHLAGNIGKDGLFLLEDLDRYGVERSLLSTDAPLTGNAIIEVDRKGENSIILFPGANHAVTQEQIGKVFSGFGEGDWLVLQNEINMIPEIMAAAKEKGMNICINPAPMTPEVKDYPLSLASLIAVNETEGAELSGVSPDEPEKLLDVLSGMYPGADIMLTLGKDGALYLSRRDGKTYHQKAVEASVVDTTAAGDTFIGYFLASVMRGYDTEKALLTAATASSVTVSRKGAAESIPYGREVFITTGEEK